MSNDTFISVCRLHYNAQIATHDLSCPLSGRMGQSERFSKRGSAPSGLKVMLPADGAAIGDCHALDPLALGEDLGRAAKVDWTCNGFAPVT